MSAAKNKILERDEIRSTLLLAYGSYSELAKLTKFSKAYVFECLTGKKNGSLKFWNTILVLTGIEYEPEFKAFQLMLLVHPKEQ